MRQVPIFLFTVGISLSSYVYADAQNFQGLRVGGNLNMTGATTKINTGSGAVSFGENNIGGGLTMGYSQKISKKTVIGLGATYSNSKMNSGTVSSGSVSLTIKGKNMWTAFVEPGILLSDNSLLYVKGGFAGMKAGIAELTTDYSFDGYVYGLGIRSMVDENLYVEVEALQYKFNSKTISSATVDVKSTQANVGVGYKF
jgi:hypothetical protein